ncbi:MAG: PhzF family phenazine biosynthesis protein [Pseudomonadota bacterium]
MTHRFQWIDAFTDRAMAGNPCVVVFDAGEIPEAQRIGFVRETMLSEHAYLQPSETADFGVRYYTTASEIPMAGHPTIATCVALEAAGFLDGRDAFTLEVGAGVIPIEIDRSKGLTRFTMTQLAPVFGEVYAPEFVAPLFGLSAEEIIAPPQTVSTGTPFCITLLSSQDALRRARLDLDALARAETEMDAAYEPFLVTLGGIEHGGTFSRLLLAPPLPAEDPFTGSATGCMAAYLWSRGLIESPHFVAEQGHWMGRPGRAEVEVVGPPDAIKGVRLGGTGVQVMSGEVSL